MTPLSPFFAPFANTNFQCSFTSLTSHASSSHFFSEPVWEGDHPMASRIFVFVGACLCCDCLSRRSKRGVP
ncbi:hypothetical protein KC321_g5 [Hortaea werneckii]|nr:hypothetical protein KC321_g5 [Hortaea werneckii]